VQEPPLSPNTSAAIEIEPASEIKTEPEPKSKPEPETQPELEPETESKLDTEPELVAAAGPKPATPASMPVGEAAIEPEITRPIPRTQPAIADQPARRSSTWMTLADDVRAALQLADELEHDLEALRQDLAEARKELRRAQQERDELDGAPRTVTDALARAEAIFSERLIVLRSAWASADSSPYRDPSRVFFVLSLLANCDPGSFGEVLVKALGAKARWKPKDSPETVAKFGRDRTWSDSSGVSKLFTRHITVGHGVNPKKCLQIYYEVLGDGRIEIAWCGEHRATVSEDT
jgi:hypothetical protein